MAGLIGVPLAVRCDSVMRIIGVAQNGEGDKMDLAKYGFSISTLYDPHLVAKRVLVILISAALFFTAGCAEDNPS